MKNNSTSEFRRLITIDDNASGVECSIAASSRELTLISTRFCFEKINFLQAKYRIEKEKSIEQVYMLYIHIDSEVVTFERPSTINEDVQIIVACTSLSQSMLKMFNDFDVEFAANNMIDIGEIIVQYLSLFTYM
jgi:hypothetical protein